MSAACAATIGPRPIPRPTGASQIAGWRAKIEEVLPQHPFQLRALQQPIPPGPDGDDDWASEAFRELAEIRARIDATISRLNIDDSE